MGNYFCKPKYLENSIIFNGVEIELSFIKDKIFNELLAFHEIASILSTMTNCTIGYKAISKICNHYNIIIDDDVAHKRAQKRASVTAANLQMQYGITNVFQLETIKTKAANTKLAKYGDEHFVNLEKAKKTCIERYGVENYSSTEECKAKVAKTNLEKFGAKTPAQSIEVLNKMKATCIKKFGVDNYWKSDEFRIQQQAKYFADYENLSDEYKAIYKDTNLLAEYISTLEDKTPIGIAKKFGISRASAYALLYKHDLLDLVDIKTQTSHYELDIIDYIGKDLCLPGDRTILDGKEIDIYVPSKNIGIEFNGDYWHSTEYKQKNYHFEKSKLAESKGIRLIHIWEHEWTDPNQQAKIKMLLDIALGRVNQRIFAKHCIVKQITNKDAKPLNEAVHLQGHRDAQVTYGLYYQDVLVQLMSFSHTHYNRNLKDDNSWEIIRGCPGSNNIVVGGVSKLFSHFVKDYKPTSVFSYCDFNKFNGKSYEAIGMRFIGYTGPDMKWLMPDGTVVNRKPKHHAELKAIAKAQIFGAGSKKYLWEPSFN